MNESRSSVNTTFNLKLGNALPVSLSNIQIPNKNSAKY